MPKKYTFTEVEQFYQDNDCMLLEDHYENSEQKLFYMCKCLRFHVKDFEHFKRTPHCPMCSYESLGKRFARPWIEVKEIYTQSGAELISSEADYKNEHSILEFRCACGSVGQKEVCQFLRIPHCEECNNNSTYTIDDVRSIVESMSGALLSTKYQTLKKPLNLLCSKCHKKTERSLGSLIKTGNCLCRVCAFDHRRHDYGYVQEYIESFEWKLISTHYENSMTKMDMECPNGHSIRLNFNQFKNGDRCYECYLETKRYPHEYVSSVFADDGYILKTQYRSNKQMLDVVCPNGHGWKTTFGSFRKGRRCIHCFHDSLRFDIAEVDDFVRTHGYILHSKSYTNGRVKISVECPEGHRYDVAYQSYKAGARCRICHFERNRGENHPSWNPELTDEERERKRHFPEYEDWIWSVKIRDDFRCRCCNRRGLTVHAHHLYNYNDFPEYRLDTSNGVTLCYECHKGKDIGFHSIYGYRGNTPEQYYEYELNRRRELGIYDIEPGGESISQIQFGNEQLVYSVSEV